MARKHVIGASMASSLIDAIPIWLPLLLLAFFFLLFKKPTKLSLPPGPTKLPFLGNLHQLGELTHVSLWNLSKKHGPVMHLRLGSLPALVVSSVDTAREILRTHDLDSCSRPSFTGMARLSYNNLDIAFAPYGGYWREARKLSVLKLLSAKQVESFGSVREEEVGLMINSMSRSSEVDVGERAMTMAANVIFKVAFGESFRGSEIDNARFGEIIHEAACMIEGFCAADFFPRAGWIVDRVSGFHRRLERSFRHLDGFFERVIEHHKDPERRNDGGEEDMVDMLLGIMRDQEDSTDIDFRFTEDHTKAILMNIFLGGVDNNAITITWAMAELSKNKRVMKKAQDEIRTHIGNKGRVSSTDLEHFPYLKMVLRETFRLHPPGALLVPRETMTHFKINGYDVCPKTIVLVNAWAIGRDGDTWENPEEFYPERFEDSLIDYKGQHFELLPFGVGRRICPGISFTTSLVELALANLLYRYEWKLPNGMAEEDVNMEEAHGLAIRKKLPLKLVPVSYNLHKA